MAKVRINKLPEGFEIKDGKIVRKLSRGGTTGDQNDYGLVTTYADKTRMPEQKDVRYSLSAVPREIANIEAEGGETVLTDLNNDGSFGLYNIKGPRHSSGGVPMYLPPQSFIFSDTKDMKFDKRTTAEFGIETRKKMTPAKISKKFDLNKYYAAIEDEFADDIQARSADLMLDKNKMQLSKLAFAQEAKKNFTEGVPVASYPYLVSQGVDPFEFTQSVEDMTRRQAEERYISSLPPQQQMQIRALQDFMAQASQPPPAQQQIVTDMPIARMGRELRKAQYGWIGQILDWENKRGYPNYGFTREQANSLNRDQAFEKFNTEYMPLIQQLPAGLQPVSADFYFNSEDPRASLMVAAGLISPQQKLKMYRNGSLASDLVDPYWAQYGDAVIEMYNNNPTEFLDKFDAEKIRSYQNTKNADKFMNEWRQRVAHSRQLSDQVLSQESAAFPETINERALSILYNTISNDPYYQNPDITISTDEYNEMYNNILNNLIQQTTQPIVQQTSQQQTSQDANIIAQENYSTAVALYNQAEKTKNKEDVLAFQRFFHEHYPDKAKEVLSKYGLTAYGKSRNLTKEQLESNEDGRWGPRTEEYFASLTPPPSVTIQMPIEEKLPVQQKKAAQQPIAQIEEDKQVAIITPGNLGRTARMPSADFWKQDLEKLRAIQDINLRLGLPFQPAVQTPEVGYILEDPTRAIAAFNEQYNIGQQAMGAFAGPQAVSARAANAASKAAEAVANEIASVNQRNVQTVNQGLARQAQMDLITGRERRDRQEQLYSDTDLALENYNVESNQRDWLYSNALINALTNRANTYNLNSMMDYYNIMPGTGGMVSLINTGAFEPAVPTDPNEYYRQLANNLKMLKTAGVDINFTVDPATLMQQQSPIQNMNRGQQELQRAMPYMGYTRKKGGDVKPYATPFYVGTIGI